MHEGGSSMLLCVGPQHVRIALSLEIAVAGVLAFLGQGIVRL